MWVPCILFYTCFEISNLENLPNSLVTSFIAYWIHLGSEFSNIECFYQTVRLMKDPVYCHKYWPAKTLLIVKMVCYHPVLQHMPTMLTILFQVFPKPMSSNQIGQQQKLRVWNTSSVCFSNLLAIVEEVRILCPFRRVPAKLNHHCSKDWCIIEIVTAQQEWSLLISFNI